MMAGNSFIVLMWKHGVVRLRRWCQLAVEVIAPLTYVLILLLVRKILGVDNSSLRSNSATTLYQTEPYSLDSMSPPAKVFYAPTTLLSDDLMKYVAADLKIKQLYSIEDWQRGYMGFKNETVLYKYLSDMSAEDTIILFNNLNGDVWPEVLNYTIRMKREFKTHVVSPRDDGIEQLRMEPHVNFATMYEPFVRLQLAVDLAFRELTTNHKLNKTIYFQELPMSAVRSDPSIGAKLLSMMPFLSAMSLGLVFIFIVTRIVAERSSGIQELIKMCGVSWTTIYLSHLCNTLPAFISFAIIGPILMVALHFVRTSFSVLFLLHLMYFLSVITLAYACSYVTNNNKYAVSIAMTLCVATTLPLTLLNYYRHSGHLAAGLLPLTPVLWAYREIKDRDADGGITLLNMSSQFGDRTQSHPVMVCILMLLVQSVVAAVVAWYLGHVFPGPYGIAESPYFVFQKSYWCKKPPKQVNPLETSEEENISVNSTYFEPTPTDKQVGIRIDNVTKEFVTWRGPRAVALSHVSLDVYRGECTVLLGHNGAGKTTLLNTITGMVAPTSGSVSLPSSVSSDRGLGYCPQHNLTFPDLTVHQHIIFFGMLRGEPLSLAKKSSISLLERLQISDKKDMLTSALSGGMKRRLQLACALAGDCQVVILDEPTSGLDVETRRELWNLLLSLRGSRTVVLSTHFMEEADALGDRVAALQAGVLTCHATPMFLKRAIGLGYRLSITTSGPPNESALTAVVSGHVPTATVVWRQYNALTYNLPATEVNHFPALFDKLEANKGQFNIQSIGMGISTLEEVFLKLCSDVDGSRTQDEVDSAQLIERYERVSGCRLYVRQLKVLIHRQWRYIMFKKWSFLCMQVLIPLALLISLTCTIDPGKQDKKEPQKQISPSLYRSLPSAVWVSHGAPLSLRTEVPSLSTHQVDMDIPHFVLSASESDPSTYRKYIGGLSMNSTTITVLYSTLYRHTLPVVANLVTAALVPPATSNVYNYPLTPDYVVRQASTDAKKPIGLETLMFWLVVTVLVILSTEINEVSLPCLERATGARQNMYMHGLSPLLYWPVPLLSSLAVLAVCVVAPLVVTIVLVDTATTHTLGQGWFLLWWVILVMFGCATFLLLSYIVSLLVIDRTASIILVVIIFVAGVILGPICMGASLAPGSSDSLSPTWRFMLRALDSLRYGLPPQTMLYAMLKALQQARKNAWCDLNKSTCPGLVVPPTENVDAGVCCASSSSEPFGYFPEVRSSLFIMLGQFIVFYCILMSYEYGYAKRLVAAVVSRLSKPRKKPFLDPLVHQEHTYVSEVIKRNPAQIPDALLASGLYKRYAKCCQPFHAVNGISFSVKPGECFGLLGVNGAGKSTTFNMLTLEHYPNEGEMYSNGHRAHKQRTKYVRSLSYCPQFLGVDEFLTAPQMLHVVLTLRGLKEDDIKHEVQRWIRIVGLEKHMKKPIASYSGGCARRSAAACALCGGGSTLLDEPTAGVDPVARRGLWGALQGHIANSHHGVVISSHSMDEMEALCSRLAIMVNGRVAALGAPSQLRELHAQGHTVLFKLTPAPEQDLQKLKDAMRQRVACTIKDEHKTMLKYRINEPISNGNLFRMLEELKRSHPIIEDYSASETTLEEVFLSFSARHGKHDVNKDSETNV